MLDTLCVLAVHVSKLSLTLDGFIKDLYEQSIFWFNGCFKCFIHHVLFGMQLLFEDT
jgi:hypothetical protein